jgi:endonuclease I
LALLALTVNAFAQDNTPTFPDYYAAADGKKGAELKTALHNIIKAGHIKRTYDNLWTDFRTTDKRSDGKVWDMYSSATNFTFGTDQAGSYSKEGDVYNREHSFPNSWFGGSQSHIAYADLNHLYPTDGYVNNRRANYCFGENNGESYKSNGGFSKLGNCTYSGSGAVKCFEPNDIYKGDFARTYFYMVTCYENEITSNDWNNGKTHTLDGNKYPGLQEWQLNMLMEWAAKDPVDQPIEKETPRNNVVYGIQGNRNPFIDYPGLEEYIWGSYKDVAFSYDNYQQPTAITTIKTDRTMHNGVMYNMAGQVVDKSYKGIVIMNGRKLMNK